MQLHPAVELSLTEDGQFLLINNITQKNYKIGFDEGRFLQQYQHGNTVDFTLDWDSEKQLQAEKLFLEMDILYDETSTVAAPKSKRKLDVIRIKLCEFSIDEFLDKKRTLINLLTSDRCIVVYICIIILALILAIINGEYLVENVREFLSIINMKQAYLKDISPLDLIIAYCLIILSLCIHELAHVFTCKRYCGKVGKIGIMLYFLQPALYSDLTFLHSINSKKKKARIFFAGVFIQWVLSAIALIVNIFVHNRFNIHLGFLLLFATTNIIISLYNLIPFIKLDGYWILSNLINIQDLYDKSLSHLRNKCTQKKPLVDFGEEKTALLLYGLAAACFFVFLWVYIILSLYNSVRDMLNEHSAILTATAMAALLAYQLKNKFSYRKKKKSPSKTD